MIKKINGIVHDFDIVVDDTIIMVMLTEYGTVEVTFKVIYKLSPLKFVLVSQGRIIIAAFIRNNDTELRVDVSNSVDLLNMETPNTRRVVSIRSHDGTIKI